MSNIIMKAKAVTDAMAENMAGRIAALKAAGVDPTLAILRVGARPDDLSYERTAIKRADTLGITARVIEMPEDATQEAMLAQIQAINEDASIHGCLMFRPLPKHLDEQALCDALAVEKDVDGISMASMAGIYSGADCFAPCTAEACIKMLDHYGVELQGKRVVVAGRSLVIGKPVSMLLMARNATVTTCHSRTVDLPGTMRDAEIVVCATGRAKAYGADCFAPGQTVIDVGINFADGKLCGDVDYDAVEPIVDAITPVPGGIGSVTTSTTMEHVVIAAEKAAGLA